MASQPGAPLLLRNRMSACARLRFHCGRHVLWDSRLQAGAKLEVPDPGYADIEIDACHLDPHTQVASTLSTRIDGGFARSWNELPLLVAKLLRTAGSSGFVVEQEAQPGAGAIGLLNLTAADVRFQFRFLRTPFACAVNVLQQAECSIGLSSIHLAVTVDGTTTAPLPLLPWSGSTLSIEPIGDDGEPHLRWLPSRP